MKNIPRKPLPEIPNISIKESLSHSNVLRASEPSMIVYGRGQIIFGTQKGRFCDKFIWDGQQKVLLEPLENNPKSTELPIEFDPLRENIPATRSNLIGSKSQKLQSNFLDLDRTEFDLSSSIPLWGADGLFNFDTYPLIDYIYIDLRSYLSTLIKISEDQRSTIYTFEHPTIGVIGLLYVKGYREKEITSTEEIKQLLGIPRRYAKSRSIFAGFNMPTNKTLRIC
ncbi:Hypothetical protein HVR_LOCUS974 [uncultured virus]|nr:Hypothetical protein HVR_LOCUS974 [uncultured virus]